MLLMVFSSSNVDHSVAQRMIDCSTLVPSSLANRQVYRKSRKRECVDVSGGGIEEDGIGEVSRAVVL